MVSYKLSKKENIEELFNEYLFNIRTIYDGFLEDHILQSIFYEIICDGETIGYYAIFKNHLLTQFYIVKTHYLLAQTVFSEVIKKHQIANAYAPSGDEKLITLCMDVCQKSELQAYFFEDGIHKVKKAAYKREMLTLATHDDCDEIIANTGDFIDHLEKRIKRNEIYLFKEDHHFIGLGIIVKSKFFKGYMETGMFVVEEYRKKGVGRSVILHLKDIAKENNCKPIAGCWYYNHNSKKTLESAGYIATKRLVKFSFADKQ